MRIHPAISGGCGVAFAVHRIERGLGPGVKRLDRGRLEHAIGPEGRGERDVMQGPPQAFLDQMAGQRREAKRRLLAPFLRFVPIPLTW